MSKAIMLSIRPKWVAKILNGEKAIEVRKHFPKDYVGWVYIYCTKDKQYANLINRGGFLTGMVVARFWCDKVEDIINLGGQNIFETQTLDCIELLEKSCLFKEELDKYLIKEYEDTKGYAIHISQLEIFDEPRELFEFNFYENGCHLCKDCLFVKQGNKCDTYHCNSLTKAPQNYCYVEVEYDEK